ncbi:MAG: hypothetical protein NW237_16290 [Cyanobacteriota bacterium]|nr:hypothetical protein [Cyanobacteriota bacterium]
MITYADLTESQREFYLKALIAVAQADEQLDEEEITFFSQIAVGVGLEGEQIAHFLEGDPLDVSEIPAMRNAVGALILRDLSAMAVVNNDLLPKEEDLILEIGKAMQFSPDEVEEFLNWAFMGLQWQLKSTSLLEKYA